MSLQSEDLRQLEHMAPLAFAFLLKFLTWEQAIALAALAVFYAIFVSSRLWRAARRPDEAERGFSPGKVAYAVSILALVLLFPEDEFIVAAVWANLSVGDAFSNLAGRRYGRTRLPWSSDKTWAGMAAAFIASALAGFALLVWTDIPGAGARLWPLAALYAAATSLVCSLVETFPLPIDDNISICASGGLFLGWLSSAAVPSPPDPYAFGAGFGICLSAALAAYLFRTVSPGGAIWGVVQGTVVYAALGLRGFVLLATFFVFGSAFSKIGYGSKMARGIAQADGGRRAWRHVWGKGFAAFAAAVASFFLSRKDPAILAYAAALAGSLCDTTATELGQLYGGDPVLLPSLKRVPRGTAGGVSLVGSALGIIAAGVISMEALALGLVTSGGALSALAAATVATHLESLLAARQGRIPASGPMMNAFHTTVAMILALLLGAILT
jgi:uncharacterized protein (TIGR00297 family)